MRNLCLFGISLILLGVTGSVMAQVGGLDAAEPIGRYLNGVLPSETPRPASGSYRLVNAFPALTFIDPVQMLPVPFSNRLMVVEKAGRLTVFENDSAVTTKTVLIDIRNQVESSHDSGMLGLAFHPEFGQPASPNRHYLYVHYRYTPQKSETDKAYIRLSRFTWDPTTSTISPASELVLINQYDRHNWHNGGGILFGPEGFLYVSVGDEGGSNDQFNDGQRRDRGLLSGILRIDVDRDPTRGHAIRRQPQNPASPPSGWPNSFTQGYFIPDDNPWPSPDGSLLEEFYAVGVRSPHRLTLDPVTGRLWLGDIGQGTREEVSIVVKGANLQWPYREGTVAGPKSKPSPLIGFDQPPVYDYGRGVGGCIIGGYVYRGALHPELQGRFLFGDHNTGLISSLEETGGGGVQITNLLTLTRHGPGPKNGLSSFGVDASGEIYVLSLAGTDLDGGIVYRLDKSTSGVPEPPQLLSQTTAFSDLATLTPTSGVLPYDVIQPLWSDGAEKKRWIAIPNDGNPNTAAEKIGWSETGHWDFPLGTVLIKHFEIPGRRLETRFMVLGGDDQWFGFTYRWREDGSDADLLPGPPVEETFDVAGQSWTWHFPGRNECSTCHTDTANHVLGVKARHLNRDLTYPQTGRTANQLVTLNRLGFFSPAIDEASLPNILTSANLADASASLEHRARSYLDINCSQCHQPAAPTQAAFDARLETPPWYQNLVNVTPNDDRGIAGAKLVKPGAADLSIVHKRVGSLEEGEGMPPLAKNIVHAEGLALLREWIESLDPVTAPAGPVTGPAPMDFTAPTLTLNIAGGQSVVTGPFVIDVIASEPIEGLAVADFTINGGTVTGVSGSDTDWTISVAPSPSGPGSLTLESDKVTDINGNANLALDSPVTWDFQPVTNPGNLLYDGEFENGLASWDSGGAVSVSSNAHGGAKAVQVGASSFVVQSIPITGGEKYTYSGWYFSQGNPASIEAGLTFWDADMNWITDRIAALDPSPGYVPFTLEFTAPTGATSVSVWILTGQGGSATVDGLLLEPGGGGEPVENLLPNGDFEGGLSQWDAGNQVTVSSTSKDGVKAAELGAESFVVQTLPAVPDETYTLGGSYFSAGNSERLEVGFSFWNASGTWIEDQTIVLTDAATYQDFTVPAIVPANTATMTIWVWSGRGGGITVDSLVLLRGDPVDANPGPENILTNGDFENGGLLPWDVGGAASVTVAARTGNGAALLPSESFLVHNMSATPGEEFRFSGFYRTTAGAIHEAGFSFWSATGEWLGDSYLELPESAAFTSFEVNGPVPEGAVSLSAWFWSGFGSEMIVDDVVLEKLIEPVPQVQPLSAGTTSVAQSPGVQTQEPATAAAPRIAAFGFSPGSGGGEPGTTPAEIAEEVPFTQDLAGRFGGLTYVETTPDQSELSGAVNRLQLTRNGRFSGRGFVAGRALVMRGAFDEEGSYQSTYRDGRTLELQLVKEGDEVGSITGILIDNEGDSHQIRLTRAAFSRRVPTDRAGAYTMLLPGTTDLEAMGFGLVRITPTGRARTLGRLGSGERLSHAGFLDAGEHWPVFKVVTRRPTLSWFGGELGFLSPPSSVADFSGDLQLIRDGNVLAIDAVASLFEPRAGTRALESVESLDGAAIVQVSHPEVGGTNFWPVDWRQNDRLFGSGARRIVGGINRRNGLFRGWSSDPSGGTRKRLEGVVFQKQQLVGGAHRNVGESDGALIIEAGEW
ncbi:MAG: PQQ-dependent sugar dehydrogenase [Verrucomicrobiae bacterium]|nr:PQQ-dependent sugar dehydrogenase [Verrucomicrobiae bacterium]